MAQFYLAPSTYIEKHFLGKTLSKFQENIISTLESCDVTIISARNRGVGTSTVLKAHTAWEFHVKQEAHRVLWMSNNEHLLKGDMRHIAHLAQEVSILKNSTLKHRKNPISEIDGIIESNMERYTQGNRLYYDSIVLDTLERMETLEFLIYYFNRTKGTLVSLLNTNAMIPTYSPNYDSLNDFTTSLSYTSKEVKVPRFVVVTMYPEQVYDIFIKGGFDPEYISIVDTDCINNYSLSIHDTHMYHLPKITLPTYYFNNP